MEQGVRPEDYELYMRFMASQQGKPQQNFAKGGIVSGINPFYTYAMGLKSIGSLDDNPPINNGIPSSAPPLSAPLQPVGLASLVPQQPGNLPQLEPIGYARGGLVDVKTMENYIRQRALARGMDPDVVIRAVRTEGLAPNTWQSRARNAEGIREPSYGPFQLLVGGKGTGFPEGMGNRMIEQTGIDPSDPANWRQGIDYALNQLPKTGWSPWYGPAKIGISKWEGIKGSQPIAVDYARTAQAVNGLPVSDQAIATVANPQATVNMTADLQPMDMASVDAANAANQAAASDPLGGLMSLMMMGMQQQTPAPAPAPAVRKAQPMDPELATAMTSQTPDAYRELLRRRGLA